MRTVSLLLFCFLFLHAQSQIRIIDQTDGQPVAFAHLLTDDGKLAATSDINGNIDTTHLSQTLLAGNKHISIQQIAYETIELSSTELRNSKLLKMQRRIISLPEVTVGRASKEAMFLVLKGYFRSYHLEDGTPKYYTDGIGEYYIAEDGKSVKFKLLEYRTFRNEEQIAKAKKRSVMVVVGLASTPNFRNGQRLADRLGKAFAFSPSSTGASIQKKNTNVGFIRVNPLSKSIQTNVDMLSPEKEKRFTLFNYICRVVASNQSEIYRTTELNQLTYDNLESFTQSRRVILKHKKDPVEVDNTGINEFFLFESRMVPKSALKGIKFSSMGLKHAHSYTHNYWEELSKYHIPPLSRNISEALGKSLTMY